MAALVLAQPAARACTPAEMADLLSPSAAPYRLACRAVLQAGAHVQRPVLIEGAEASGAGLDCSGGRVGVAHRPGTTKLPTVAVWSRRTHAGWSAPRDVSIRRCVILGNVRIWGMGAGGAMSDLRDASRQADFTRAAQAAAPSGVTLDAVRIEANGSIPLYVGPGVTRTTMRGSTFTGRSVSTAVYLDAESANAVIDNNDFSVRTGREIIAMDGSGANRITGNRFDLQGRGGVFLYRNCGEDGVIRHQTPSWNRITDNTFTGASWLRPRLVVVGSREGGRPYCGADAGWPFGSSADDGDNAVGNTVERNRAL
ncbi:right-handed parallel beta-helix repeat-containing protein [Brevundimonas sp. PAMC22021]|uniref:right-handed parallel beta-helix repeat-containing protein n=1 Tax=Brevundimonas sp. PAMC22021 TaxID=2861285 RepID=UPI00210355E2|nr:right-handed parallel beta-helix repeat-containing protein [Brevundimonas sp. PAMC22021]